jgi:hypothetical protein
MKHARQRIIEELGKQLYWDFGVTQLLDDRKRLRVRLDRENGIDLDYLYGSILMFNRLVCPYTALSTHWVNRDEGVIDITVQRNGEDYMKELFLANEPFFRLPSQVR